MRSYVRESIDDRFWRRVSPEPNTGCWLWDGAVDRDGYGKLRLSPWEPAREERAHRLAWSLTNGSIPRGAFVCHSCDHPWCVNPRHLFLGSPQDNVQDMIRKGRRPLIRQCGEAHPRAKVTRVQVATIRARRRAGEGLNALAREYGLHNTTVLAMVRGETWVEPERAP